MKVFFSAPPFKLHTLYQYQIDNPPKDVEYVLPRKGTALNQQPRSYVSQPLPRIYNALLTVAPQLDPRNLYYRNLERAAGDCALILACGHVGFGRKPWIVDLEHVGSLFGFTKGWHGRTRSVRYVEFLRRRLRSAQCNRIVTWTKKGRETVVGLFNDEGIREKTEVVHLGVPIPDSFRRKNDDIFTVLFAGSINNPDDFYLKGGREAVLAFKQLCSAVPSAKMIVRSSIPADFLSSTRHDRIEVLDSPMPRDELNRLFVTSDVLISPTHATLGMLFLEALSFGLPVIASDVWANSEMIENNVNGILVPPPEGVEYTFGPGIPRWNRYDFLNLVRKKESLFIERLSGSLLRLASDKSLLDSLSLNARRSILERSYTLEARNTRLREIYTEATKNDSSRR